jgi:hypothetical protein
MCRASCCRDFRISTIELGPNEAARTSAGWMMRSDLAATLVLAFVDAAIIGHLL